MKNETRNDGDEETDFSVMSMKPRRSTVQADGSLLLSAPRKGSAVANLFKKKKTTKVVLFGGDNRVPFMALYQVKQSLSTLVQAILVVKHST